MSRILEATEGKGLVMINHGFEQFEDRFDRVVSLESHRTLDQVAT